MGDCITEEEQFVGRSVMFARHTTCLDTVVEEDEVESSGDSSEYSATGHGINRSIDLGRTQNMVHVERDPNDKSLTRHRRGAMLDERAASAERISALESAFRGFAERKGDEVLSPIIRLSFDSLGEAYDYYNLYSWECGFGIRYGKSRLNVKGSKCMQELLCNCSGKPKKWNNTSCRSECAAMIRLLRTDDDGWYICEFRSTHNHEMLHTCAQKLHFSSHRHIDKYIRELVLQLRENNVNLSKVYSIIGTFFGRIKNVPFTERCLRTLCGKISCDQADEDVKKTMDIFSDLKEKDPEFYYSVRVDGDSRIRTLMWTNGSSKLQYHHFGDVVTFDTTYRTNLYDMPFGLFVGVNNHFQTVIFAGVLMQDEKIESFNLDQARAMEVAIEQVFPDITHRWCKWHVMKKAKESLGVHYHKKSEFGIEFHKLVQDMITVQEFEDSWQGGAVLKVNLPIEKHAIRIYTRTMFEMFGSFLFALGSYTVEELIPKKKYVATHLNATKWEKYLKSVFEIEVSEEADYYTCECGLFEHMGMVCCHIIKVMCELRLSEIPKKHVMKRWTLEARDILPDRLKHYQKDIGLSETRTFRHSKMYIAALELVKMGDMNVAAYEVVMNCLIDAKHKVIPLCDKTDGMSIVEKAASMPKSNGPSTARANSNAPSTARANSNEPSVIRADSHLAADAEVCSDRVNNDKVKYAISHHDLAPPPRKKRHGRPTTARDKAPYENKNKRSKFCTICRREGHKCTTCPMRGDVPTKPRQAARCSNCGLTGHWKTSCVKPMFFSG
ncbi:hypothetical protein ACQ4PT_041931 [Festuca glaucescens]